MVASFKLQGMKNPAQILESLGLTENESKVFLSAIKTGSAPVSRLARHAGIARTYVYELVEQLQKKGLVAEIEERGIKKIQALDYAGLLSYVGRRQTEMAGLEEDIINAQSAFQTVRTREVEKTHVRYFDGVEGIKAINAEIRRDLEKLKRAYSFYVVFSADRMEAVLPRWIERNQHIYFEPFMKKYAIISQTPLLPNFLGQVKKADQKNFQYKVWPEQNKEFPTDTLCWLDKIAYLDMQDHPSGTIIQNPALAKTFVMWFEQMWGSL